MVSAQGQIVVRATFFNDQPYSNHLNVWLKLGLKGGNRGNGNTGSHFLTIELRLGFLVLCGSVRGLSRLFCCLFLSLFLDSLKFGLRSITRHARPFLASPVIATNVKVHRRRTSRRGVVLGPNHSCGTSPYRAHPTSTVRSYIVLAVRCVHSPMAH